MDDWVDVPRRILDSLVGDDEEYTPGLYYMLNGKKVVPIKDVEDLRLATVQRESGAYKVGCTIAGNCEYAPTL